jgi:hypothetical protein
VVPIPQCDSWENQSENKYHWRWEVVQWGKEMGDCHTSGIKSGLWVYSLHLLKFWPVTNYFFEKERQTVITKQRKAFLLQRKITNSFYDYWSTSSINEKNVARSRKKPMKNYQNAKTWVVISVPYLLWPFCLSACFTLRDSGLRIFEVKSTFDH